MLAAAAAAAVEARSWSAQVRPRIGRAHVPRGGPLRRAKSGPLLIEILHAQKKTQRDA